MKRIFPPIVAAAMLLSACAPTMATLGPLQSAQQGCAAGDPNQCAMVPYLTARAREEADVNSAIAGAILIVPLVILAAAVGGSGGGYYYHGGGGYHHHWH
jgi:hypothetical protein